MGCYYVIDGCVNTSKKKTANAKEILRRFRCDHMFTEKNSKEDHIDFQFYGDQFSDFPDELAEELSPYVKDGEMTVTDEDNESHYRYRFSDGSYQEYSGTDYVYYPGLEAEFVSSLPNEVIREVLEIGGKR